MALSALGGAQRCCEPGRWYHGLTEGCGAKEAMRHEVEAAAYPYWERVPDQAGGTIMY